ncbi:MAG: HesA/MoeB/ThiF family protein [Nitrososphaerota archaeon]|nr:HesA/MoeB/ThiF family protein [Nitrososphaerota archaeon]
MADLSPAEQQRYSRQILFSKIGYEGQLKIRNSNVTVVGVGGTGSGTAQLLAGIGPKSMRIVDRDIVSISDLHRQQLYDTSKVGYPKVEVAADRLERLNPDVEIVPLAEAVVPATAASLVEGSDLVLDCLDSMGPRYLLSRACLEAGIPYVYAGAIESYGTVFTVLPGKGPCLDCIYPSLDDSDLPRCAAVGVNPAVLSVVSGVQVSEAVRLLVGEDPLLADRLLFIDVSTLEFSQVRTRRREDCPACGKTRRAPPRPFEYYQVACGRDGKGVYFVLPRERVKLDLEAVGRALEGRGHRRTLRTKYLSAFDLDDSTTFSILESGVGIGQVGRPVMDQDGLRKGFEAIHGDMLAAGRRSNGR